MSYDPERTATFYDEYGDREWRRFEDGPNTRASLEVHMHYLRRFVRKGDRVLGAGAGPRRFTIELARWRDLEQLLARHGEIVAAAATGLLKIDEPPEPELQELLTRLELDLGAEPGAIDGGEYMLAVLRKP